LGRIHALSEEDLNLLSEYDYRAKNFPWTIYPLTAVPAILPWHQSSADVRVLAGPNRGGKTTAGAFEIACYATGFNPIRNEHYKTPNTTWAVCLSIKDQGPILMQKLSEMLPMKEDGTPNWRYWKQEGKIELGPPYFSRIYIKGQQDGREAFYGEGVTAIWIDEGKEGETGKENFNEMLIREIPGQPLKILVTLTPLNGADWLYNRLWNEQSPEFIRGTYRCNFSAEDTLIENGGFWSRKQIESRGERYDELERDARLFGKFTPFSHRMFFSAGKLIRAMELCAKPKKVRPELKGFSHGELVEDPEGPGQLYRPRETGHTYLGIWDPASGNGGGDYSAFVVLDRADLATVFQCKRNDMDPEWFYRTVVLPVCNAYGGCLLAIEVNGEGGAAAVGAAMEYTNLYYSKAWDKQTATITDKVGWRTTEPTRRLIIDSLSRALREARWTPTQELLEEMSHMVVKVSKDSGRKRVEHSDGFHDDIAFAHGIGYAIHYSEPVYETPNWSALQVSYRREGNDALTPNRRFVGSLSGNEINADAYEGWKNSGKELPLT